MSIFAVNQRIIRDITEVQLLEHAFVNHAGNHVIRRDNDVVTLALQAGVQSLIGLEGVVNNMDAGFVLKLLEQIGVDILPPVVNIDDLAGGAAAGGQTQRKECGECQC